MKNHVYKCKIFRFCIETTGAIVNSCVLKNFQVKEQLNASALTYTRTRMTKLKFDAFENRFDQKTESIHTDKIYGNRENIKYLNEEDIKYSFLPLRRKSKNESQSEKSWRKREKKLRFFSP